MEPPTPSDGVRFGRYRLQALLRAGSMARVYRARQEGTEGWAKAVALKRLWGDDELDLRAAPATASCLRSLINEAELGSRLNHPNIVAVHDFDSVRGRFYLAMELVPGWTLEQVLSLCRKRGEPLPAPAAVEITLAVARALEYAHSLADADGQPLNLVHRDLKPANILIGRDGAIKVSDFGIAKAASNVYATMGSKMIKGTPRYMSPEQALGQSVDRRSDLFSLGTLLAEMILGRPLWDAGSLLGILAAVADGESTRILLAVKRQRPEISPILNRLLVREPVYRYQRTSDLVVDLAAVQRHLAGPQLGRWIDRATAELPPRVSDGEFGEAGAPSSLPRPRPATSPGRRAPRAGLLGWLGRGR